MTYSAFRHRSPANRVHWHLLALNLVILSSSSIAIAEEDLNYLRDIRPILAEHCFACHGPDSGKRQGRLRLDQRQAAIIPLESGKTAIQVGRPDESELIRRIESEDPSEIMPPPEAKRPITAEQKKLLSRWIEIGAPYAEHWAYLKPVRPVPSETHDSDWIRNEIDQFVLAKLESLGLRPSPEAERITLIRRLSFDLTGLPPTIEEVDAFLEDDQPNAYERLIERLLASPHFGEKLALDWLDLARFGDSSGYQDDGDRPNSPYRDYVIDAFNANMPFDQFTIENLAGDLLPNATLAQKVASGFSRLHRHNEEGGSDPDEFQVVYAVDRTNTVATTWMGITFGCAQCHDHKYDPISQREYYGLYAFFNSLKGEVVVSKSASPPQIRVPSEIDRWRLNQLDNEITSIEQRQVDVDSKITAAFELWRNERHPTESVEPRPEINTGAIGGVVARTKEFAWYGDTHLDGSLSLNEPLKACGRVVMIRSVNNIVDVGHFFKKDLKNGAGIGLMAAEGPRFFASVVLPGGTRLLSPPLAGEHGAEYSWAYRYDPTGGTDDPADPDSAGEGILILQLNRVGQPAQTTVVDLTAAQRGRTAEFDAFGMLWRGADHADTPLEILIDDVEYSVSNKGEVRQHAFDRDPKWAAEGNRRDGHQFGFDPNASTSEGIPNLTTEQILALPAAMVTPQHIARLRELFVADAFPEVVALQTRLDSLRKQRESVLESSPQALVWEEMEQPRVARILAKGDYLSPGDVVDRNVPAIFPSLAADDPPDRLTLARWLVSGEHPLTARVAVNRLWKQCFGAGLVRTPEDFGVRGEPPDYPELLDWLATELSGTRAAGESQSGSTHPPQWDMKCILRLLVTSATYRQSSSVSSRLREADPQNRLLARGARFRLAAEEIRDAALVASGLLTRRLGGRSTHPYQSDHFYRDKEDDPGEWKWPLETSSELYRRGLYTFLRRTTPYPSFQTFDAPSRGECAVARARTNTPLQALVTMNDPAFIEAARVLGERVANHDGDDAKRLIFAFRSVLSRWPTADEQRVLESLISDSRQRYRADPESAAAVASLGNAAPTGNANSVEVAAWTAVATALLNLDEAITRE